MRFIVVGARGRWARALASSTARASRRPGLVLVVLMASACTLTGESFAPPLVDRSRSSSSPAVPAPAGMDEAPRNASASPVAAPSAPPLDGSGEERTGGERAGMEPVPLQPSESSGEQLGASGELPPATDAGVADAGAEVDNGSSPPPVPPEPAAPVEPICPTEAFEGSCYEFFEEFALWSEAEELCVLWGGHLASVQSDAEDTFLQGWPQQVGLPAANAPGIWLGATDVEDDGEFLWSDGTAFTFERWAPNQPDNGIGIDCIEKRNEAAGLWYDQRCTDERPYVCERPL